MKILISIALIFVGLTGVFAQTTKQDTQLSPALQESEKLSAEVVDLFKQKKFDDALPLAQKVIEIQQKESGKNHISAGRSWRNLAYIQLQLGKRDEAEKSFENAFDIYESNQPLADNDEKAFAELLDIVAIVQVNNGKFEKGIKKLQKSLELQEKFYGKDSLQTSNLLVKLAKVHYLVGENDKAAPLFLRALDIKIAQLGKENNETRAVYDNAFCILSKLGKEEQAEQLQEKFYPLKTDDVVQADDKIPVTIKGGVINGKALMLPRPEYPTIAKVVGAKGAVQVQVTIDEAGNVIFACALSGRKELHRASEIAAYKSKFAPTLLEGKAVRVIGVIVYNFAL